MMAKHHASNEIPPSLNGAIVERFVLATPFGPIPGHDGVDTTTAPAVLQTLGNAWESIWGRRYGGQTRDDLFYGLVVFGSLVKGRFHSNSGGFAEKSDVDVWLLRRAGVSHAEGKRALPSVVDDVQEAMNAAGHAYVVDARQIVVDVKEQLALFGRLKVKADTPHIPHDRVRHGIRNLFLLAVGTGGDIPQIRNELLDGLAKMKNGDVAWQAIARAVIAHEEHRRGGSFAMPGTVGQARSYFKTLELEKDLRRLALKRS